MRVNKPQQRVSLLSAPVVDSKKLATFWQWFSLNARRLKRMLRRDPIAAMEQVRSQINRVDERIISEMVWKLDGGSAELIITPDGDVDCIELVKEILKASPNVPDWKVTAFRARSQDPNLLIQMGCTRLGVGDVKCRAIAFGPTEVVVILYVPNSTGDASNQLVHAAILLMDHVIGELDSMTMIRKLHAHSGERIDASKVAPLSDLAGFMDSVRDLKVDQWPEGGLCLPPQE